MLCRACICPGRIGISDSTSQQLELSTFSTGLHGGGERTLPNFVVCADTAAKGVCSGSAESISSSLMALSACRKFCNHSKYEYDGSRREERALLSSETDAVFLLLCLLAVGQNGLRFSQINKTLDRQLCYTCSG